MAISEDLIRCRFIWMDFRLSLLVQNWMVTNNKMARTSKEATCLNTIYFPEVHLEIWRRSTAILGLDCTWPGRVSK
jgi:hypothetical protein